MTPREIARRAFDECLRAERVHWIGCQEDQYSDELKDVLENVLEKTPEERAAIFSQGSGREIEFSLLGEDEDDDFRDDDLAMEELLKECHRKGLDGFLVEISTPCPLAFYDSGGYSTSGFGYYTTEIFYTDVIDGVFFERVLKWKAEYLAEEKERLSKEEPKN